MQLAVLRMPAGQQSGLMEKEYGYFERDISWLSFNYRVLLEAGDSSLPLYERINFVSIYSSNLEEFYQIRVAEHRAALSGGQADAATLAQEKAILQEINGKVNAQLDDRIRIYEQEIIPELACHHVVFYQGTEVEEAHRAFITDYFREEIFPYLQPVRRFPQIDAGRAILRRGQKSAP